jgi:hypothetical protein
MTICSVIYYHIIYYSDVITWRTLLGACRIHHNVEVAEIAAERALEFDSDNAAVYIMLGNMYPFFL